MEQMSVFDILQEPLKIDKPVRLIELFAGIGSQAKALQRLGVDFEHYRVCEFDKYAISSYNAIHGTDFATSDITQITADDLGIVDTDKYYYILTYSFPCQDLSLAGKQKLMAKGSGTRSSLLWEVERLLNECVHLPQVLLMENVTQVHGKKNKEHFDEWIRFLESKGYQNYWQDLNAKNFGIPQNRNRTFMVSVLGEYTYEFPEEFPLELRLKDMLEDCVEEKYYLSQTGIELFKKHDKTRIDRTTEKNADLSILTLAHGFDPGCEKDADVFPTLTTGTCTKWHAVLKETNEPKLDVACNLYEQGIKGFNRNTGEVLKPSGICNTIQTMQGGNRQPKILEPKVIAGIGEKKSNGGTQWYQQDRIYDNNVAISVTTAFNPYYKVDEPLAYDEQNGYIRKDGTVGTLTTDGSSPKHNNRVIVREANKKGYDEAVEGDSINLEQPNSKTRRGRVGHGVAQTIMTAPQQAVVESIRIRKLTPLECWRLMGFDDEDFYKASQVNSNSQLYKQAGNSIVVDVLYFIFLKMF